VVAATNDRGNLDSAVIRNGRFNRQINIPSPRSRLARLDILKKATTNNLESKGWTVEDRDTSLERLARIAIGSSGADLVGVLEKAQALSRRRSSDKVITFEDIMEGFQQQSFGFKMSSMVSPEQRRKTAYHELVGHGVIAWACEIATFLISMEPRGESLGRVIPDPEALSELAPTKQQLLQRILVNVAGQVAERQRYGELGATVGNTADLESTRGLLKLLISTGLLGEDIATSLLDQRQGAEQELSESQKALMNRAYARAVQTVQSILAVLTNEEWDRIVDECLHLNKELIGDEAQAFLEKHLGSNEGLRTRVRQALDAYYNDPLGNNPTQSESAA
jgi:cell division protease FtsH